VPGDPETSVRACYSTWSKSYYTDYYGPEAPYPPVHLDLLKRILQEAKVRSVLDAGCGPASILRHLAEEKLEVYGFDLAPEMVAEARRVLGPFGVPAERIWQGSVLSAEGFRPPAAKSAKRFDAAICIGVLPHIPEEADIGVIRNLRGAVRKKGLVVLEARNAFFALFTLNRYSYRFFLDELVRADRLAAHAGKDEAKVRTALAGLEKQFRMDLPPERRGKAGAPGYDEVLSRTHNPLALRAQFAAAGFNDVRLLFYHYHCVPPMFEAEMPELFRRESLQMEDPEDWRGYFMASAFMVVGRRA
jgi:SAM-dependent methyltransferase